MNTNTLLEYLDSVIAIPVIPFSNGIIDYNGHAKNVTYLMQNNYLSDDRPRVIAIGGTSLLHHISFEDQIELVKQTGKQMESEGVLISGIVPNPIEIAGKLIEAQSELSYPPDAYLLMPLSGISSPEGVYDQYQRLAEKYGNSCNARFIYYLRQKRDLEVVVRLIKESPYFIGVKIGTDEDDVKPLIEGVDKSGLVIWGIGDRCTEAAELGTKGHTSGIAVVFARTSDEINNAQRQEDYQTSRQIESKISALEDIRFTNGRVYNYSAVVEAMILSGFEDIEGGNGGPFNPRVPAHISAEVQTAIKDLSSYH